MSELVDDQHIRANNLIVPVDHPTKGRLWQGGSMFEIDGEGWLPTRPAPLLGQHTDEVLADHGYTAAEVAALRASGAVA